jgi:hypothetical protein
MILHYPLKSFYDDGDDDVVVDDSVVFANPS